MNCFLRPYLAWPRGCALLAGFIVAAGSLSAQSPAPPSPSFAGRPAAETKEQVSAVPALPDVVVRREASAANNQFDSLDIYWWQGSKKPQGTLILADETARTEVFMNEAWVAFARQHRWNLLVLGVKAKAAAVATASATEAAAAALEQRLLSWVDARSLAPANAEEDEADDDADDLTEKKGPPPVMFYATGNAAAWMESVMLRKPGRFSAWLAVDPSRAVDIPRIKDFKPSPGGYLVFVPPLKDADLAKPGLPVLKRFNDQLDHFEDLRSRNGEGRVSFIPWAAGVSGEMQDSFARTYLHDAMSAGQEEHLWLNIHTLTGHPLDAKTRPDPTRYAWFPSEALLSAAKIFRPFLLPRPLPGQARRFFKTREFAALELRWIRNVPKPKAVLVIAANTLPRQVRTMPEWLDYARKKEWAILLMGLKEDQVRSVENAAKTLEKRLYREVELLAGPEAKNLPLITYAQGTPALWLQTLMLRQPARYQAWIAAGAPRFPAITTAVKVPPGLIISQNAGQQTQAGLHFEDLRGADPYNPVCYLSLPEAKPSVATMESACRLFLEAAAAPQKENVRWLHLHDLTPPPSTITSRPNPRHYAWFPNPGVVGLWKLLRMDTVAAPLPQVAKRTFKTKLAEMPELNLFVRMPGTLAKGQAPNGVLCFCTWQQEDTTLVNRLKSTEDSLVTFADRRGMAMITWNTASMLPAGTKVYTLTPEQEADIQQKFNAFGEEWRAAVRKVCHEFKLEDKDMLLHGVSRGAAFAHQISMRYPQQFLAVHTHIGSRFNETVPKEAKDTFWLVTTGEADGGYGESFQLYSKLRQLGAPAMFKAGESLGHASRRDIEALAAAFFNYALDLRVRCEREKEKDRKFKETPQSLFLTAVTTPPWYGDYINHQAFRVGDPALEAIPKDQCLPLPTEFIAKAWGMSLQEATAKKEPVKNFAAGQ